MAGYLISDIDSSGMDESWHSISNIGDTSSGAILAEVCAKAGSPWFSGHFPKEPILPGIAMLAMVTDTITHHEAAKGRRIRISAIRRVRFKLPVRPDESLRISLSLSDQEGEFFYHFRIELDGKTVCTGIAVAETLPDESQAHEVFS